jgi:parallel beta-helix repeat protein
MKNVRSLVLSLFAVAILVAASDASAQCFSGCPTNDEIAIQQQLDAAAAAGGGVVQLEARVYLICEPLIVGSNTTLRGAGRGATILRGSPAANGKIIDGSLVLASIATVGTRNVVISDLTIDHTACQRNTNGISLLPKAVAGAGLQEYAGDPVENSSIERVEVLGAPQFHSYMIWNLRGRHIKITGNWVDGGASSLSNQEGIESFGGHDVLISGNTVKNIGFACLSIGSAGLRDSGLFGITATDNHLANCTIGVNLGTSKSGSDALSNFHTRIAGNVITGARKVGIDLAVVPGTVESDLIVTENSISDMDADQAIGILLRASETSVLDGDAVVANTISDNHIQNIRGTNANGIKLLGYPNVRLINNTINGTDHAGIFALDSDDLEIVGNRVEKTGSSAIVLNASSSAGFARFVVERNVVRDWKSLTSGILVLTGKSGIVRDNVFSRTDPFSPSPVTVASKSCSVVITGNTALYDLEWPGQFTLPCR